MYRTIITDTYTPFGSGLPREEGLHLTSIIRDLQVKLGMAKKAEGWDMNACADIGFLWEGALSYAYRDRRVYGWGDDDLVVPGQCGDIARPDPVRIEGVWMSPDGIGEDPKTGDWADHEFKCTWRSMAKMPEDDFYWDTQFKCYCKGMGVQVTILHAMYLMGNYRGSGPRAVVYRMEYTQAEIDKAWGMVMRHKEVMGS